MFSNAMVVLSYFLVLVRGNTFNQDFEDEIIQDGNEMDTSILQMKKSELEILFSFLDHPVDIPVLEEAVLILGNSGTEKSALAKILGAYNTLLLVEEIKPGKFKVIDLRLDDQINNLIPFVSDVNIEYLNETDDDTIVESVYDCAKFSYEKEISVNIASSYFNKKITEFAQNIKLIFVINHTSFKSKGSYDDLKQLFQQMQKFVKNIDKYEQSIGLIVEVKTNDTDLLKDIIKFLKDFVSKLEKDLQKSKDQFKKIEIKRMQQCIQILIEPEKIILSVGPSKPGDVSKNSDMQLNRHNLYKFIEKLEFSEVEKEDFGYTLSLESYNEMLERMSEVIVKCGLKLDSLFREWIGNFEIILDSHIEDIVENIPDLYTQKLVDLKNLRLVLAKGLEEHDDIVQIIHEYGKKLNYTNPISIMTSLKRYQGFLFMYSAITETTVPKLNPSYWTSSLEELIDSVTKYKQWYAFTWATHHFLSSHTVQFGLENFQKRYKLQANFSLSDFTSFFNKLVEDSQAFSSYQDVTESELTVIQIKEIHYILNDTLFDTYESTDCSQLNWYLMRNSLSLSLLANPHKSCMSKNQDKSRFYYIMARNKIYLTGTMEFTTRRYSDLILIAPEIEVINEAIIHVTTSRKEYAKAPFKILIFAGNVKNLGKLQIRVTLNEKLENRKSSVLKNSNSKSNESDELELDIGESVIHNSLYAIPVIYKENVIKKINTFNKKKIMDFLEFLSDGYIVSGMYNTESYARELTNLIKLQYDNSIIYTKMDDILLKSYISLEKRIVAYSNNASNYFLTTHHFCICPKTTCVEFDSCDKFPNFKVREKQLYVNTKEKNVPYIKTLGSLYTSLLGQITALENKKDNVLIVEIKQYLEALSKAVDSTRENLNNRKIQETVTKYKQNIDSKIQEAGNLISDVLQPEITEISELISAQIRDIIAKIVEMEKKTKERKEEIIKMRDDLNKLMIINGAMQSLGLLGSIIGVMGPIGAVVGGAINVASTVGTALGSHFIPDPTEKLNAATSQTFEEGNKLIEYFNTADSNPEFSTQLQTLKTQIQKLPIEKYQAKIESLKEKIDEYEKQEKEKLKDPAKKREIKKGIKIQAEQLAKEAKNEPSRKIKKALTGINSLCMAIQAVDAGIQIYKGIKAEKEKIEVANQAIRQLDKNLEMLGNLKDKVTGTFAPMVNDMTVEFEGWADGKDKNESLAALEISKYEISQKIKNIRLELQKVSTLVGADAAKIGNLFEKLDSVMTTTTSIYDKMENYREQQQFADFQAGIQGHLDNGVGNPDLDRIIVENKIRIQFYTTMFYYQRAMSAFRLHVFPFATFYQEEFEKAKEFYGDKDQNVMIKMVKENIDELINKLEFEAASIREGKDDKMIHEEFNNGVATVPFYIWNSDNFQHQIQGLLEGKKISMFSHIFYSLPNFDAIKFRRVMLKFQLVASNESVSNEFQNALDHFSLVMTHTGNNYYKYNEKYYIITSPSVTIERSFEMKGDKPRSTSEAYNKLNNGDLTLSPFTVWICQLRATKGSFDLLAKYKNLKIDLHLEGRGMYINSQEIERDLQLERFYNEDDTLLELSQNSGVELTSINQIKGRSLTNGTKKIIKSFFLTQSNGHYKVNFGKKDILPTF